MGRKKWATVSEEMLHRGFAALAFLRAYTSDGMGRQGIRLAQGLLSKFGVELQFLKQVSSDYVGFSLGNASWGCLMWPVLEFHDEDSGFTGYYLSPPGEAHWVFLLDLEDWMVVRTKAHVFEDRIFMVIESKESLLRFFFADVSLHKNVNVPDLLLLCSFLGIHESETKKLKRADLIHKLVDQIGGADSEFIAEIKADMVKPEKTAKTIGDALDELVFGELPGEDQDEFKMVAKEVESKQKAGWNLVESQWRKAMAKTKAKKRPKAKAKPKCRGNFGRRKRKAAEMAT
jgi:hypothetical protein